MENTAVPGGTVATDETLNLISAAKVVGTSVYNRQGEKLGSVYTLMLNKLNGQVAYAVMSFGGFLGIGESYHPLPWRILATIRLWAGTWWISIAAGWKARRSIPQPRSPTGVPIPSASTPITPSRRSDRWRTKSPA